MKERSIADPNGLGTHTIYTQPDKVHMYCTKYELCSSRPTPATCGGRATGIISGAPLLQKCDIIVMQTKKEEKKHTILSFGKP